MSEKGVIICTLIILLVLVLPLGITSIVLGATQPGKCDLDDKMGLNVSQYLLGLGISSVTVSVFTVFLMILLILELFQKPSVIIILILTTLNGLFGLCWFIVGAVILFRGNIECIRAGSSHVIFALVLWCISAFYMVKNCCHVKISKNSRNNDT